MTDLEIRMKVLAHVLENVKFYDTAQALQIADRYLDWVYGRVNVVEASDE